MPHEVMKFRAQKAHSLMKALKMEAILLRNFGIYLWIYTAPKENIIIVY
jgi:hypothetical protein